MYPKFDALFSKKKSFSLMFALIAAISAALFYFFDYAPKQEQKSNILWHIVSSRCAKNPAHKPCLAYHPNQDYVLLKDLVGKAQVLLIPLRRLHGVESTALGKQETPNYFQSAWQERAVLSQIMHRPVKDEDISLSINSRFARSQNQLHIHISCLKKSVAQELHALDPDHLPQTVMLEGNPYKIHLTASLDHSPFFDLNKEENFDPERMGKKTIVVAKAPKEKFYILTTEVNLLHLNWGSGESLQDHNCKID